jgi:hypothetical protein
MNEFAQIIIYTLLVLTEHPCHEDNMFKSWKLPYLYERTKEDKVTKYVEFIVNPLVFYMILYAQNTSIKLI